MVVRSDRGGRGLKHLRGSESPFALTVVRSDRGGRGLKPFSMSRPAGPAIVVRSDRGGRGLKHLGGSPWKKQKSSSAPIGADVD